MTDKLIDNEIEGRAIVLNYNDLEADFLEFLIDGSLIAADHRQMVLMETFDRHNNKFLEKPELVIHMNIPLKFDEGFDHYLQNDRKPRIVNDNKR